ncbi:hypothetical protein B0J12DRAFT_575738 [Macrophomina phaseolina]|uniref:DUF676 domain-containing protein n=1 Tax=Macrophomina phaseolina TaxID=35725 RepID=A0ABQ8G7S2_9PEZI|nr:hypothetical protein B0J12DRAFT_575738 [Macrophomina phaseolina]
MHPLHALATNDPRSSSTQSLVPVDTDCRDGRRKLLLIYIHGFMGDETSFQSFPAHVHNLVTVTLRETHVVHTKIYPKYRARNTIEHATEQFSKWLTPHATPDTDIILLGHSMGGLLSAEVVLLPPHGPAAFMGQAFRHRILGFINFDVPFLGMHPGIIGAGLSSIFRPAEDKPPGQGSEQAQQASHSHQNYPSAHSSVSTLDLGPPLRNDTLFSTKPNDPNYNPRFDNDVILPVRKGWENALHFITKHSDGLVQAGRQYVRSHLEFGGAMADYPGLKKRYKRARALDEEDEAKRRVAVSTVGRNPHYVPRVRFVNFYTASTGRPKKPKTPEAGVTSTDFGISDLSLASSSQDLRLGPSQSRSISPSISVQAPGNAASPEVEAFQADVEMEHVAPMPMSDHDLTPTNSIDQDTTSAGSILSLSEIPPPPVEPLLPELDNCLDEEVRKATLKEHEQALKEYKRALKERNNLIKQRAKAEERLAKEAKKEEKRIQKAKAKEEKEQTKQAEAENQKSSSQGALLSPSVSLSASQQTSGVEKKKRDRKFCILPDKDPRTGQRDPAWIRVFMEGMDEVGAHCGLFFVSETYERLVGEVAEKIERWVLDDVSERAVRELESQII